MCSRLDPTRQLQERLENCTSLLSRSPFLTTDKWGKSEKRCPPQMPSPLDAPATPRLRQAPHTGTHRRAPAHSGYSRTRGEVTVRSFEKPARCNLVYSNRCFPTGRNATGTEKEGGLRFLTEGGEYRGPARGGVFLGDRRRELPEEIGGSEGEGKVGYEGVRGR